jgi:uncharacterized membrane protein (DUF485 family)
MSDPQFKPAASFRKRVLGLLLDFFTILFLAAYLVAWASGSLTPGGFCLHGRQFLFIFVLAAVYVHIGAKLAGGRIWDRLLGIKRPQPY